MVNSANKSTWLVLVVLAAMGAALAAPMYMTDDAMARRDFRSGRGSLDEGENQLRYAKTTDYGATWTLSQAGDLSTFSPHMSAFGDFSAVVMGNGELCYLITLLDASTPGVYSLSGPSFTPVLVVAQGSNDFSFGYNPGGHTDISRAPDGSLVGTIWGANASGANTLWGCKSANNGSSWNAWVIASEPTIPPNSTDFGYFKMADRCHSQWCWALYQEPSSNGFDYKVLRFDHVAQTTGTVLTLGEYSTSALSFMFGGTKPMAYDVAANYLQIAHYNHSRTGAFIYFSNNAGQSFQLATEQGAAGVRYPSSSVRPATQTPFFIYGETVGSYGPGDTQCLFYSYDEIGYDGGAWTDNVNYQCTVLADDGVGYRSLYFPQMWWWDANHAVTKWCVYTAFLSGEIIETNRTTDGGATWIERGERASYRTNQYNASTMQPEELCGGENGLAYVVFSASSGITDEVAPTVTSMELLSSPLTLGPYVVRAYYDDNVGIDTVGSTNGPWVNWAAHDDDPDSYVTEDSTQLVAPERQSGWYYFTIPDTAVGGIALGDSIYFYCDGYDVSGLYANAANQIIVAGVTWLDIMTPHPATPLTFKLYGNYPNPFNPATEIRFEIPRDERVDLLIYNSLGQSVRTVLENQYMGAGLHQIYFDAAELPSGLYFYRLTAGQVSQTAKMVLLK